MLSGAVITCLRRLFFLRGAAAFKAEASRILRDHMPNVALGDEDMVRSAWRRAELGRNDLALGSNWSGGNNNVGPYPV